MIIDLTKREPKKVMIKTQPKRPADESVTVGDDVEVEVVRNGKTLYKGR